MSKSIKLKNNTYIDSTGVAHKKSLLSTLLDNITNNTKTLSDSITQINNKITSINNSITSINKINFKNANTEYKTGEYFLGKPVYMMIFKGDGQNKSSAYITHKAPSNLEWIIRFEGSALIQADGYMRVFNSAFSRNSNDSIDLSYSRNDQNIELSSGSSCTLNSYVFAIYYTKK